MAPVLSYERLRTCSQTALRNTGPPAETPPHVHSPLSGGISPTFVLSRFICPPRSQPRQPCPVLPSLCLFLAEQRSHPPLPALPAPSSPSRWKETKTKGEDPADTGAAKWFYTRARVGG